MDKPKGKPLSFQMVGWEYMVHLDIPTMTRQHGKVHQKSIAREVTHPNTILA